MLDGKESLIRYKMVKKKKLQKCFMLHQVCLINQKCFGCEDIPKLMRIVTVKLCTLVPIGWAIPETQSDF